MALLNKNTGEYIVVEAVSDNVIILRFHKDQDQRWKYKSWNLNQYEITIQTEIHTDIKLKDISADASKSIKDNQITAGYNAIKLLDYFKDDFNDI